MHFPMIVKELSHNPLYGSLLVPMSFPMSLTGVRPAARLTEISIEGELLWTSSILSLHSSRLNSFIPLRDAYYAAYEDADYDSANSTLHTIQQTFGFSIWLLGQRIQLLQVTKGLEAQKTFLEEILSTDGLNQFIAWVTYFLSVRAEENVSFSSFESDLSEVLEIGWLRDYATLHFLPTHCALIENPALPIAIEEPHPVIDRFQTFVAMVQIYCAKLGGRDKTGVITALEQLDAIEDPTMKRMLTVLRGGYLAEDSKFLALADAYTEGRYEHLLAGRCSSLELVARSYAFLSRKPPSGDGLSLRDQLIGLMYDVSVLSSDAPLSRQKLMKLAILCPDRSATFEVATFLEREYDHLDTVLPTTLEVAAALGRALDNPWSAPALDSIRDDSTSWLDRLAEAHPDSSTVQLRQDLSSGDIGRVERNEIKLPPYRQFMYLGHIHFRSRRFDVAAKSYLSAAVSEVDFISHAAKRALFKAYYSSGKLYEAVRLAIDQVLHVPSAAGSYPLETLARQYLDCESAKSSIDLAVLLHLAIRHCNAKLERDLSNIYENLMVVEGLTRPSAFRDRVSHFDKARLVYFLRHVCVPRILDDTTCFDSVEEIDQERISVCQLLLTLDPSNIETYKAEIRAITRDSEVAALLSKMQTSKIYVDEAGIRESLEVSLAEPLARYLKLLESPSLAYQAEKLSKRLTEMLTSKGHPEFKNLKLPATELEGLFSAILLEASDEFALNPAYGLDTHVSTSIRHGAFEGHLRRSLVLEDLLCIKKDKEYVLPTTWSRKLPTLGAPGLEVLQRLLSRFTQRFEELIHEYLKGKLHIRVIGNEVAMFNFEGSPVEIQSLMDSIAPSTTVQDLADRLIAHFWGLTTKSLDAIRQDLLEYAAKQMSSAFDGLVRGVESRFPHLAVVPFVNAVARSRTAFQTALEDAAGWFQRPTDLSRDPFDIDVAMNVSLNQIANCYVDNRIRPSLTLEIKEKVDGRMLDGLCEILFILLQNVIRHSGLTENKADVSISARRDGQTLILQCASKLSMDMPIEELRVCAMDAMKRYERDSALKMARKEGGSGLSKVWRIAEFDLRVQHTIELSVTQNKEFVAKLSLAGVWA
jgi:hypothetical protein